MTDESQLPEGSIPVDQFQTDSQPPAPGSLPPGAIPVDQFESDEDKYGTVGQQAKGALEAGLSAATFGGSTVAERELGIATPEDMRGREENLNPALKVGSQLAGIIGSTVLAPEAAPARLAARVGEGAAELAGLGKMAVDAAGKEVFEAAPGFMKTISAHAVKNAFEGALFEGGQEVAKAFQADNIAMQEGAIGQIGMTAVLSGLFGGALGAASDGLKKLPAAFETVQDSAAAKALGFTKSQIKKLKGGPEEARDIARTMMDAEVDTGERIFTPLAGSEDIAHNVEKLRANAGERMGQVYQKLDEAGSSGINPLELASKIDEKLGTFWRSPINKGETNQLENVLESVLVRDASGTGRAELSFAEAQKLKEEIAKVAYPGGKTPIEPSPRTLIAQDAHRIVRDEIDKAVDAAASKTEDKTLLAQLQKAREQYGAAKKAGRALADKVAAEQGNKIFGLTDTVVGSTLASHGLGTGAAAVVLKKLAEKYGPTAIASSKDAYLDGLNSFVRAFGVSAETANATKLGQAVAKGFKSMNKAADGIFDSKTALPSNVVNLANHRERLTKLVEAATSNPEKLMGINENNPVEDTHQTFASTAANAVSYLAALKPMAEKGAPLDGKKKVNSTAMAKYNRALDIVQNPYIVMHSVKDGTLTSHDVAGLAHVYPNLYKQMREKLTDKIMDASHRGHEIPYKTRIGLSLFMGQPLDSSLKPASIMSAQPKMQPESATQGGHNKPPSSSSMKGLSKMPQSYRTASQAAEAMGKASQK